MEFIEIICSVKGAVVLTKTDTGYRVYNSSISYILYLFFISVSAPFNEMGIYPWIHRFSRTKPAGVGFK